MADEKTDRQGKLIYVPELQVMAACDEQLELLEPEERQRVLAWLARKWAPPAAPAMMTVYGHGMPAINDNEFVKAWNENASN